MRRKFGFTLVELLVVIAIISILAAIVVPNVADYIRRARMTRAVSEINNAELAITKMLTDADKKTIAQFFENSIQNPNVLYTATSLKAAEDIYTDAMYILLRRGKDGAADLQSTTGLRLTDDVLGKLGTIYLDIGLDPFGNKYRFFAGPLPRNANPPPPHNTIFRSFRAGTEDRSTGVYDPYIYNTTRKQEADAKLPGNPPADNQAGLPAPTTQSIYIYSPGEDLMPNQLHSDPSEPEKRGGGDDINNWDNERGWSSFYN